MLRSSSSKMLSLRCLGRSQLRPMVAGRVLARYQHTQLRDANRPMRVERELPDPTKDKNRLRLGFLGFSALMVASLAIIFNYEKTESPIVSNTLYHLRRSPRTKSMLGENIEFDGLVPWVYGELNQVAGKVNIHFYIKGENGSGMVRLEADRKNRREEFLIHEWSLTCGDQKIDLLSENDAMTLD